MAPDYLRDVSEAVLYAFLKPNDFDNKLLRFALRVCAPHFCLYVFAEQICSVSHEALQLPPLSLAYMQALTAASPHTHTRCVSTHHRRHGQQEIVATCTLQPVANMMSDPDYINQFPACLIDDSLLSFNSILDVIK